jgi:alpha-glucosidase
VKQKLLYFIFFLIIIFPRLLLAQQKILKSPDGQLIVSFETISANRTVVSGKLVYSVIFQGKPLIDKSALRLELQNQASLGSDVKIVNTKTSTINRNYKLIVGKTSFVRDHYNSLQIELEENGYLPRKLTIEARAYNDAIAFRYLIPEQANFHEFSLVSEGTEFRISKDATTYSLLLPDFKTPYESEFIKLPISALSNQGGDGSSLMIGLPALMEVPGVAWLAITEADLRGNSSMYLTANPSESWTGHWFNSILAPQAEDSTICISGKLPHNFAWRVLMVSTEPGKLIESNVITSLNPETALEDISWIHAGKASWNWWSGSIGTDGKDAYTTENMKNYVDFAAKSGFEYMLIDGGWSASDDITKMNGRVDVPEVVEYAKSKNVKIWIWLNYLDALRQMDEAFPLYEKWGVSGLKIDHVKRDDQKGIDFYYQAAEKAAQHHLMLDIHGSTKPSGISRTYPNLLGYEGVLGMEQSKAGARDNPESHVMLPFTRMLVGFMDYTPGGFNNVTKEEFEPRMEQPMVMGTRAHHLAMYVVYEAPFQMVSDHPGAYKNQPSFQFIKDVPATWDETKVLNGIPGEYVTIVRRSGDEWFLGSMSNWTPRQIGISLSFLGEDRYVADIYMDAPDSDRLPKSIVIKKETVSKNQQLKIQLASGGGYAVRFKPLF